MLNGDEENSLCGTTITAEEPDKSVPAHIEINLQR